MSKDVKVFSLAAVLKIENIAFSILFSRINVRMKTKTNNLFLVYIYGILG